MKFIISTIEHLGFFYPAYTIVLELIKRGHDVVWLAPEAYEADISKTGARFLQTPDYTHISEKPPSNRPQIIQHAFIDSIPGQIKTYLDILEKFPADALLVDVYSVGARCMRDLTGLPYVTLGAMPFFTHDPEIPPQGTGLSPAGGLAGRWFNRICHKIDKWADSTSLTKALNEERTKLGLHHLPEGVSYHDLAYSDMLHLMTTTPAFEFPRKNMPASVRFVGPLLSGPDIKTFVPPNWWDELLAHPKDKVIYVNHGYMDKDARTISLPAVTAFADHPEMLVIIHENVTDPSSFSSAEASSDHKYEKENILLPKNVRVASHLPHSKILPHVGILVQYAEYINVLAGLKFGVPMVCIGDSPEMLEVSSRVVWCGAGVQLRAVNPLEAEIRKAVFQVLDNKKYQEAAEVVKEDFSKRDSPREAADELEGIVNKSKSDKISTSNLSSEKS
jgi:UDP:flavonoid glycosyltransferase YjiC (YdhE family)